MPKATKSRVKEAIKRATAAQEQYQKVMNEMLELSKHIKNVRASIDGRPDSFDGFLPHFNPLCEALVMDANIVGQAKNMLFLAGKGLSDVIYKAEIEAKKINPNYEETE